MDSFLHKRRLGDWGRAHEREGVRKVVMWLRTFVWIFVLFDRGAGCLPNEAQKKAPRSGPSLWGKGVKLAGMSYHIRARRIGLTRALLFRIFRCELMLPDFIV